MRPGSSSAGDTAPVEHWWDELTESDGLVLRDRVLGSGVEPDLLVTALRSGRLFRVQRGVYGARSAPPGPAARARAAVLSSGVADAVASHHSAARVHGLAVPERPRVEHVTVRREDRRIRRRDLHFHSRRLGLGEVVVRSGTPLTTPARTVFDLAVTMPRLDAVWCVDDALRRRVVTPSGLGHVIDAHHGGRGDGVARERLGLADGLAESILETAGRLALRDRRVPLPVAQHEIRDPGGRLVARVDGAYPSLRLAIELDGKSVHSAPEAVFRDRRRQNELESLGWRVLRFTWWDVVHDGDRFAATVRGALVRGAA